MRCSAIILVGCVLVCAGPGLGGCSDDAQQTNDAGTNQNQQLCGDGVLQSAEECDDGAANSDTDPDACRTDCRHARCGDGVVDTAEALLNEHDTVWGSMVKQALKRKRPQFSESAHGYRNFSEMLKDAEKRGLLSMEKDRASGGYLITSAGHDV